MESSSEAQWPRFSVLGVGLHNATRRQAIARMEAIIRRRRRRRRTETGPTGRAASVFFVNAHTLNLSAADASYRETLNTGDFVLADGTGVRWAARLQGVRVAENMVGTDFVPEMFQTIAGCGYRYFMLGADAQTIAAAAHYAAAAFPHWRLAGWHHGYLAAEPALTAALAEINAARPDVLLVGMGNPVQEQWIRQWAPRLDVGLCLGIGGLFDYWAGNVSRAPAWLRRLGHEWTWRLLQQPRLKANRYLFGHPLFIARVLRERWTAGRGRLAEPPAAPPPDKKTAEPLAASRPDKKKAEPQCGSARSGPQGTSQAGYVPDDTGGAGGSGAGAGVGCSDSFNDFDPTAVS
jgi:N-acetylglucosaminyldiphosphoundecaprenol N-acetyl-beta-D-mannosaminyltransferase